MTRRRAPVTRLAAALIVAVGVGALATPAQGAARLTTGFFDDGYVLPGAADRAFRFDRTVESGAKLVRILVTWAAIAPAERTASFNPRDPGDPAYRWDVLDAAVKDARARGLDVLLSFYGAPAWAEGPGRAEGVQPGSWSPDPAAVGNFAAALAARYSGRFADPASAGVVLPPVRRFQVWNEPNLTTYLAPQWSRGRLAAPGSYRKMLNAAYKAIKAVSSKNFVVSAGTAPYGDHKRGGRRTAPVTFLRELLCLKGSKLKRLRCPSPARLDAISHHPYGVSGPTVPALNADDVVVADISKLVRVLRAAERAKRVLPRKRKRVWVTEVSWDSRPPDPDGVSQPRQARWLSESFYLLWRQGVEAITWYQVVDAPPGKGFPFTTQSGVYLLDGSPKLSQRAFVFPFVARRDKRGRVVLWAKPPSSGTVEFQRRSGTAWRTVLRKRAASSRPAYGKASFARGKIELRAVSGGIESPSWTVPR